MEGPHYHPTPAPPPPPPRACSLFLELSFPSPSPPLPPPPPSPVFLTQTHARLSGCCRRRRQACERHRACPGAVHACMLLKPACVSAAAARHCWDRLAPGSVIVFDELLNYAGYERNECLALFQSLCEHTGAKVRWIGVKHTGCQSCALQIVDPGKQHILRGGDPDGEQDGRGPAACAPPHVHPRADVHPPGNTGDGTPRAAAAVAVAHVCAATRAAWV